MGQTLSEPVVEKVRSLVGCQARDDAVTFGEPREVVSPSPTLHIYLHV